MLLATTVNWFLAGLIALVPTQEGMRVLLVDARQHRYSPEIYTDFHPHEPLLVFTRDRLLNGASCSSIGGVEPPSTLGHPLRHLFGLNLCVLRLDDVDVEILNPTEERSEIKPAGGRKFWFPGKLPQNQEELKDYTWLSKMRWIDWPSRKVDPGYLGIVPTLPGVTARLNLAAPAVRSCHLATFNGGGGGRPRVPFFHYTSLVRPVEKPSRIQALSDAAEVDVQVEDDFLKLRVSPHQGGHSHDFELGVGSDNKIQVAVINLMQPPMGCGENYTLAADFSLFYDLAVKSPPLRARKIPNAVLSEASELPFPQSYCNSTFLQDILSRFACPSSSTPSANNRPTCPLVVFDE